MPALKRVEKGPYTFMLFDDGCVRVASRGRWVPLRYAALSFLSEMEEALGIKIDAPHCDDGAYERRVIQ